MPVITGGDAMVFDVDAEHRPFELRAEIVRLRAVARGLLDELREHRAEVERLRSENEALRNDAELGLAVRAGLPKLAELRGQEAWLCYDHDEKMWNAGCSQGVRIFSCEPDNAIDTALGDVLRKA